MRDCYPGLVLLAVDWVVKAACCEDVTLHGVDFQRDVVETAQRTAHCLSDHTTGQGRFAVRNCVVDVGRCICILTVVLLGCVASRSVIGCP